MRAMRKNETRARHLDTLLCNLVFMASVVIFCLLILAFLATRTHMFHAALTKRQQKAADNAWLIQQCKKTEFYSNMKHHSTLCDDVVLTQADALWLHSLRDVIDQTYLCGEVACIQRVEHTVEWIFGRGVLVLGTFAVSVLILFLILVHIHRHIECQRYVSYNAQAKTYLCQTSGNPAIMESQRYPLQGYSSLAIQPASYPLLSDDFAR